MKITKNKARYTYSMPCIWITKQVFCDAILAGDSVLNTTIKNNDYAIDDGRSNMWSGFDEDEQNDDSRLWGN